MNENAYDRLTAALRAHGCKVIDRGHGKANATCPAHEDRNPSMSITGIDGRVLVWCHVGCPTRAVVESVGLTMADLYDERSADYRYDDGRIVHRRYDNGKKTFPQTNAGPTSVLYHLDQLRNAGPGGVFLVEGEADVHAIEAFGGVAVTAPQGADSFHKCDVSPLAGRHVTAVVDRDKGGDKWAAQVFTALDGVAAAVRFVRAKEGKDASDHLAAGHGLDDFERYDLPGVVVDGEYEPTPLDRLRAALLDSAGLDSIPDPEPLIGESILFRDCLAWMVGKPGHGKSFVALDMAGCVGTGEPWQGNPVRQGPVLYLVAEGARGTKKRVRAWEKTMNRTMENVYFLPLPVQSTNATEWKALVELAREVGAVMIVLDTQARVTVGVEENSNKEMGEFVHQAERLRAASSACVLIVHHIGRNGDTGRGATVLDGALSTIIKVTKDDERVTLECTKNKDAEEWAKIDLRAVPVGDSLVLMPCDGLRRHGRNEIAHRKWVRDWWDVHRDEPVSVSVLVKSDVVSETTFHRSKLDLINTGIVETIGEGNWKRYRLRRDPAADDWAPG